MTTSMTNMTTNMNTSTTMEVVNKIIELNNEAAVYLFDSTITAKNNGASSPAGGGGGYNTAIRLLKTALNLSRTLHVDNNNNMDQPRARVVVSVPSILGRKDQTMMTNNGNNTSSCSSVHFQFLMPASGGDEGSTTAYSSCFINQSCSSRSSSFLFTSPVVIIKQEGEVVQLSSWSELEMISSIMIYNTALAYHLLAVRCYQSKNKKDRSSSLLQASSSLYEKAIEMSFPSILQDGLIDNLNNGADSSWISLYLMAILFNQGHAYDNLGNTIQCEVLYEHLLAYVLSSCTTTTTNNAIGGSSNDASSSSSLLTTTELLLKPLLEEFLCNLSSRLNDSNRYAPAA